jgi:DNA-directed RNA polymerase subunit K/omega
MKKTANSRGTQLDNEQCVENVGGNRFDMVLIAAARSKEIKRKNMASERRDHIFPGVTALLEIQNGEIGREYLKKIK